MTSEAMNDLPDEAFAYIEPGGTKDSSGRTSPRSKRHFPVHDAAHVRAALTRANASPYGEKAMPKILAAAKKHGVHVADENQAMTADEEVRELRVTSCYRDFNTPLEMRDIDGGHWVGGYASVFMPRQSRNLGGFVEQVANHAFEEARAGDWHDVVCRFNHDSNYVLGTTAAHTLTISTDRIGLRYDVLPPESRKDVLELVARGDIRYSSFAFRCNPGGDEWAMTEQGFPVRTLHSVELLDVSPVLSPGYPDASVAVRSTNAALRSFADFFQAEADEVRALAEAGELRKFFTKVTSGQPVHRPAPRTLFGPAAAAKVLARRRDPLDIQEDDLG
jgi:HK97 family phage prohead protease